MNCKLVAAGPNNIFLQHFVTLAEEHSLKDLPNFVFEIQFGVKFTQEERGNGDVNGLLYGFQFILG